MDWQRVTEAAPWAARAGAAVVVKDAYIYLLGGEDGFTCDLGPLGDDHESCLFIQKGT